MEDIKIVEISELNDIIGYIYLAEHDLYRYHIKEGFVFVGKSNMKHMDKYILKKQED